MSLCRRNLPQPRLAVDADQAGRCRERAGIAADRPLLALCPGAEFGGAKRWPADYFGELALRYIERGWQVALFGSANDQPVTAAIRAHCSQHRDCIDLAGRTQLAEAVDLLWLATAVVSNDSGLMHIAAALARPLVVIYGATSPGFTPPSTTMPRSSPAISSARPVSAGVPAGPSLLHALHADGAGGRRVKEAAGGGRVRLRCWW